MPSTSSLRTGPGALSLISPRVDHFVVLPDRAELGEIVRRGRDRRLRTTIGKVAALDDAVAVVNPTERISGLTIIRIRP